MPSHNSAGPVERLERALGQMPHALDMRGQGRAERTALQRRLQCQPCFLDVGGRGAVAPRCAPASIRSGRAASRQKVLLALPAPDQPLGLSASSASRMLRRPTPEPVAELSARSAAVHPIRAIRIG